MFMGLYPGSRIDIVSTDSRGALVQLFSGEVEAAVISRDLEEDERQAARDANVEITAFRIAIDGIAFIVNSNNRVDRLTMDQVAGLLDGKFRSWKEVGGEDLPVVPILRDRNSGTYEVVRDGVLKGVNFAPGFLCRTSQEVVDRVASESGGIGCTGLAWLDGERVKAVQIAGKTGEAFARADAPHVYQNRYPVRRPFFICAVNYRLEPVLRVGFISFLTSQKGQTVVERAGLVPDTVPERIIQLIDQEIKLGAEGKWAR